MIAIRVDGDESMGVGHFMRCLALARTLKTRRYEVVFLTGSQLVQDRSIEEKFPVIRLTSTKSKHLDAEINELIAILRKNEISVMLIDSYKVTPTYLTKLGSVVQTVCLDDLQQDFLPATAVINGNISAEVATYCSRYGNSNVKLFVGTRYCIMRDEFLGIEPIAVRQHVEDIFVSTGGADPRRASVIITKALLADTRLGKVRIHVLVGSLNPHADELESIANENARLEAHKGVFSVSTLMAQCDLAVAAAGTTLNELCVCGVPTVTFSLADNQVAGAYRFNETGAALNAGHVLDPKFTHSLLNKTVELASDSDARIRMAGIARSIFDGKGACRVAHILATMEGRTNDHLL